MSDRTQPARNHLATALELDRYDRAARAVAEAARAERDRLLFLGVRRAPSNTFSGDRR